MNNLDKEFLSPRTDEEVRKAITPARLIHAIELFRFRKAKSKAWQRNQRLIRIRGGLFIKESHLVVIANICLNLINAHPEFWIIAKERILDLCGGKKLWRFVSEDIDCLGYILVRQDTEPLLSRHPVTPGLIYDPKLISPIDPKDPRIKDHPEIVVIDRTKNPQVDHIAEIKVGNRTLLLSRPAFEEFIKDARRSGTVKKKRKDPDSNGGFLLDFFNKIKTATPVQRKNRVTQIIRHGFEEAEYFWNRGWVFVVTGNIIKTCYEKGELANLYRVKFGE